jgi:D-psicose/D-tagatose/L-ribulose 3-epimerase
LNPIGINLWNWTNDFNETKLNYIKKASELGYTAIEIGLENVDFDPVPVKMEIDSNQLQVTLCAALSSGRDISSFDENVRQSTKQYMKKCFQLGESLGAKIYAGPIYAGGGKAHLLSTKDKEREWKFAVDGIREMAEEAANHGMSIAIEPLNRYRTSVVNTIKQALQLIADINKDNVGILFDTYQANIEEVNIYESLKQVLVSGKLFHVQLSDSNRGAPGMGHIDFDPIFSLLKEYRYMGHITVETFARGVFDCGWNELGTPDDVAKIGMHTISHYL